MNCRGCGNTDLQDVLDLLYHPWCNDFRRPEDPPAEKYPLKMVFCPKCSLAQLDYTVKKEIMFSNHTYVSGTTKTLAKHFLKLAHENKMQFNLQPNDLIVDIGGNDGTQLLQYQKLGFQKMINVESATNIAKISVEKGIHCLNAYFNEETVDKMQTAVPGTKAKLINASGVFFHLEELHSVIKGIKKLLDEEGVFIVQFMYLVDIIKNLAFDAIYHEHLCYYTLESLNNLLSPYDLVIIDAYESEIHGGSMMVKVVHKNSFKNIPTARYVTAVLQENHFFTGKWARPDRSSYGMIYDRLRQFSADVSNARDSIRSFLINLKANNQTIYGYGSPAKGTTMLNYCGIDKNLLDKLVEINRLKIGLISPGTNIPIEVESPEDIPDYYFLLAWNFADEIVAKNKDLIKRGVKFISPLPTPRVIE